MDATELSALVRTTEYQESRQHVFPSQHSLDWFMRMHRNELIKAGAMLLFARQWRIHTVKFDQCVLDVGAKQAQRRARMTEAAQ